MYKVVHLLRWFLPFTGSFIRNQILYHQRYQPSIVFTQKKDSPFQRELGNRFEAFQPFDRAKLDEQLYKQFRILSPSAKNRIRTFIRRISPDVLHVHYGVDCSVFSDIINTLDIPACVSFYGYDCTSFPRRFGGYGKTILQKKVFRNPNIKAVLAMTEDMKEDLLALGCPEEKIIVHYYGTETRPFYNQHDREPNGRINYLIISGLHPKKGHSYLLEAFRRLSASTDRSVHLDIVGDGPLRREIEAMIRQSGLDNVQFHGSVKYGSKEHFNFLARADVFVHPSVVSGNGDKEGIPGAIIEAMSAGLPVVATYHAGIPEIIDHGVTGVLVPEKDTKALQAAMTKLATDKDFRARIGRQGQIHAVEKLDVVAKEKELEKIYDNLS